MQDSRTISNHQLEPGINPLQANKHQLTESKVPSHDDFDLQSEILYNKTQQIKSAQATQDEANIANLLQDNKKGQMNTGQSHCLTNPESSQVISLSQYSPLPNLVSDKPQTTASPQLLQYKDPIIQKKSNQKTLISSNILLNQDQSKPPQLIVTKKQIQEQKQHLNELKQKKKQQEQKKIAQKINEQQKERLQKLKQQTRNYQQMKKQRDNQIMQFQNQLQSLKKNKEKQIFRQKQQEQIREIQQKRQKEQRFYQQMMLEKERMDREILKREEEMRILKIQQEQQKIKQQQYLARVNSSAYQKALKLQQQKQQEERRKIHQIKQFLLNRNNYQQKLQTLQLQIIQKQRPPPVKQKSQRQLIQQHRRLTTKALSAAEIYKMGQEFMEEAHETISEELIQQSKMYLSDVYNSLRQSSRTEYKDYLKEDKAKRERFFKSTGRLKVNPEIRELKQLIVKEENSPEKLLKAKLLTERLESRVVKKTSLKLKAESIAAKLKVIEEFT